ncbi:hypothetical protein NX722_05580 [Endozoicomonas gorgoniicola]|uniref:Fibronectin type-III domain-containing protein n=1 Tax=Endozoicomonas gorgoniicola TaxID=1234144 RepID=A0ABT3MRX1_9GAMM|nr:hypothetical protein [Endozoicomonas gorgoniicola]MCW7552123.1 hypothetical protein [Endozoicomonas gorgoniicola]
MVSAVVGAVVAAAGWVASNAAVVAIGAMVAYGVKVGRDLSKLKGKSQGTSPSDRKQMVRSSNGPLVGLLGRSEISGTIFFAEEIKSGSQLHLCLALCGHAAKAGKPVIRKCHRIMMDDVEVPQGSSHNGKVYVRVYDGSQTSINDIEKRLKDCYSWQDDMVGKGICFAHLHLKFDRNLFPNGLPNFKFLLDSEGFEDREEKKPVLMNSAVALERYLRDVLEADNDEINRDLFDQAIAICNETVIGSNGKPEPRYGCNGCWDYSESHRSVIENIVQTCAGSLEYVDGQFGLRAGAYNGPPDFVLTTNDIIGDIVVQPMPERKELSNVVSGTHVNPDFNYQTVDFPEVRSEEYIKQDGEELNTDFDLEMVHSTYQAQRLASLHMNRSRLSTVTVPCNFRGYECGLGRNIRLDAKVLGYDNTEFTVEGWEFTHDKGVNLVLRQDYPELWNDYIGKTPVPPPDTILPNPRECLPVDGLRYSERQVNNVWESRLDWSHRYPGAIREYRIQVFRGDEPKPGNISAEYTSREPRCIFQLPEQDRHMAQVRAVNTFGTVSVPVAVFFFVTIPEVTVTSVSVPETDNSVYPCRAYVVWQTTGDNQYPADSVQYECETRLGNNKWLSAGTGLAKSRWLEGLVAGDYQVRVRARTPMNTFSGWRSQSFSVYVAEQPKNLSFKPVDSPTYWGRLSWEGSGVNFIVQVLQGSKLMHSEGTTQRELYLDWQPPGNYQLRVRSVAGASESGWASVNAVVNSLLPPKDLKYKPSPDNPSSSGVLTWTPADRRTEFHEIEVLKESQRLFAATDSGNFQLLPALVPDTYIGRVRSVWRQATSGWKTVTIRITESVDVPENLIINPPNDASYQGDFSWSAVAGSFAVRIRQAGNNVIETTVISNNYRIPLLPVGLYSANVRSLGTFSDSIWVSTPLDVLPPEPPSDLEFTETPDNAASYGSLTWESSPSAGVSGYLVKIRDSNGTEIVTTQTVTTRYAVGNLPVGRYQALVSAVSFQGSDKSSPVSTDIVVSSLNSPKNLSYSESLVDTGTGLTTQVIFRWEAGDSRTQNYDVEYRNLEEAIWSGLYSGPSATATINGLAAGDYFFRVRALSYADQSGWSQIGVQVKGFNQPPADVENLQLRALGSQQALLTWGQISSPDVINGGSVHVRHTYLIGPAAVWESSVPLTERLPGNTTFFSVPLLSGTYFVKAVNGNGYWSKIAASVVSTMGNLLGYNRVVEREEPNDWPGEKNKAVIDSGGSISFAEDDSNTDPPFYIMDQPLDLGALLTVRLYLECDGSVYEVDTIDERTQPMDDWPMFDGVEPGGTSLQYHVSSTEDDPNGSDVEWSDWTQFLVGEFRARAFRLRISLMTDSKAAAGTVSNLKLMADVPDRSETARNIEAPANGLTLEYQTPFLAPAVIGITLHGAKTGDYWDFIKSDEKGFTVRFFNRNGDGIAANFDYLATSYGEQ